MTDFDPTKPVRTRDGRAVTILATGVLLPLPCGNHRREDGQTIAAIVSGSDNTLRYFDADGSFSKSLGQTGWDLVNIPPERVSIERFRTFRLDTYDCSIKLGGVQGSSLSDVSRLVGSHWHGVLKLTTEDERLVAVEVA
jgi:hypothetical protein